MCAISAEIFVAGGVGLCACGSGLRAARCCALDPHAIPDAAALARLDQLLAPALDVAANGEAALLALLDLAPTHAGALRALHARRAAEGKIDAARAILEHYVEHHPNDWWGRTELAMVLMRAGDERAIEQAKSAVRLTPKNPRAHDVLGIVLIEMHRPQAGAHHCARAVTLSERRDPALLANMAWGLKSQGRLDEAREAYREAASIAPDSLQVNLGWGQTEAAARNPAAAEALLDRAAHAAPDHPGVIAARVTLLEAGRQFPEALALLDAAPRNAELLLARGRVLDRLGRYDEAFAAFDAGKAAHRAAGGHLYPADEVAAMLARHAGFYTARRLATLPRATRRTDMPLPIFIFGFPRSGTTMMEQALSAHSMIAAGDELPMLGETADAVSRLLCSPLSYPEALAELWMGEQLDGLDVLRDHYLRGAERLGAVRRERPFFTDKMPLNETHMGLAALLFPDAPMIHVLRHPLDIVLSVHGTLLTHGFNCASELTTIALHYARVADFVAHIGREVAPSVLTVRYEELVADLEPAVRTMLGAIGLPFEPGCLAFHTNRRYARTASQYQVSEPLYTRSRYRWRNYRAQLAPVLPILAPVIERLGYSLE